MKKESRKIIFAGGGTLGPVTPLVAVIESLREEHPEIEPVWFGTYRGLERIFLKPYGLRYYAVLSGKIRRYLDWRNLVDPFFILFGFLQSLVLLIALRPRAVVSAGGFVAVPIVWAAGVLGIPVVLHQPDVAVGLANRMCARFAKRITVAFAESANGFGKKTTEVIGNPVRKNIEALMDPAHRADVRQKAKARWNLLGDKPCIVAFGGGTGALVLNERVAALARANDGSFSIFHISGKGKQVPVAASYYRGVTFVDVEMADVLSVADLVVTRAGAGALTECAALGLPMVLLPLAGAQEANAYSFAKKGAALVLPTEVSDAQFIGPVTALVRDHDRLASLSRVVADFFPNGAAEKLAKIIMEVVS